MLGRPLILAAALLAAGARTASAQQSQRHLPVLGATIGSMSIESAAATQSQVGDRSYGLQLDAGVLMKRHFYLGVDVGGQFLKDNAQFTQATTGGTKKSTASVTYFSAITGLRTSVPNALPVALGLNAGYSATVSRRSIDQCVDCNVDKLDIPGGAFVEPMLLFGRRSVQMRIVDRFYLTGEGMRNVISAGIDFTVRKR